MLKNMFFAFWHNEVTLSIIDVLQQIINTKLIIQYVIYFKTSYLAFLCDINATKLIDILF